MADNDTPHSAYAEHVGGGYVYTDPESVTKFGRLFDTLSRVLPGPRVPGDPDRGAVARTRADRLAKAATDQMQAALAYLSMIDPEAFEIAFTVVARVPEDPEDEEPVPLCATRGAPVGIFPEVILNWRHFLDATTASGTHETYDPGHASEVAWYLPDEVAEEF